MDQKKEFLFLFFFFFLFVFVIYKFYFYRSPLLVDHDRYSLKKVDKKRSLPFAYRFLIFFLVVVVGIFLIIIYYFFNLVKTKKQEVILKDEQVFEDDGNLDGDGIDDILGYEQNVIKRNNDQVYYDSKALDSIRLDGDLFNHVAKLKEGEAAVFTDRKIFQKGNNNHLRYFSDREIDFFDRFLLTDDKKKDIRFFFDQRKRVYELLFTVIFRNKQLFFSFTRIW